MLHQDAISVQPGSSNSVLCYSIIGIHGIAGSGKSTLAQLVCANEKKDKQEKKDGHFDLIMWVHVSQHFSVDTILTEMLEAATGKKCGRFNNLDILEQKLEEALGGKRFLLVLDDIWCHNSENQHKQQKILTPLRVGKPGSKVLVTSRTENALLALGALKCIPISELDDNAFLKLFLHYALPSVNMDEQDQKQLEEIGANIAKKLRRSPLAARTVGGQLQIRPNVDFWRDACNRDLLNETMGALWWSYQHLNEQVRRCFSYCSIFPRRHQLKRDELVTLWVAEGFITTADVGEEEVVARQYFDDLVSSSFLQTRTRGYGLKDYFTVHDLLHDLAEKVAGNNCYRIQRGWAGGLLPQDVRHLYIETYDNTMITERILELENLRTLIIARDRTNMIVNETVFESIFTKMKKLRVLIVETFSFREQNMLSFPASFSELKHLRYFGFPVGWRCKLVFPSTFTKLYHLQVFDIGACGDLVFASKEDLCELTNLRHVIGSIMTVPNFGRLTSLLTVPNIRVTKEVGYELQQLAQLNKLRGKLWIRGLQNVESKEAAVQANLAAKEHLQELTLTWDGKIGSCPDVEAEVLEGLCPPTDLEILKIMDYKGSKYPSWLVGQQNSGPKHLRTLELSGSSRLISIPEHNELFRNLYSLVISYCSWDSLPENMERLTSLKKLVFENCDGSWLLPALPQSLEEFDVTYCYELAWSCQTIDHQNWQKIKNIPKKKFFPPVEDQVPGTDHGERGQH
ncbi:hypothetical protein DAI22_11g232400 [Oryza sativa Japonica Group]|nr:hypothetical protein DAI22_11g232400 [Oryza sativa Japonica Group]